MPEKSKALLSKTSTEHFIPTFENYRPENNSLQDFG